MTLCDRESWVWSMRIYACVKNSNHRFISLSLMFRLLSSSTTVENMITVIICVHRGLNCSVASIMRCSVKCLIVVIRTPRFFGGWGWTEEWHNYVGATWCETL